MDSRPEDLRYRRLPEKRSAPVLVCLVAEQSMKGSEQSHNEGTRVIDIP